MPILLTLVAFQEMEIFLPRRFDHHLESAWIRQDIRLLDHWHLRAVIESFGPLIPYYLELCYLVVYGLAAYCVGVALRHREPAVYRRVLHVLSRRHSRCLCAYSLSFRRSRLACSIRQP